MSDILDFDSIVKNAINEAMRERGHVNILIAGSSGVGKSTLINAIFQGDLATVGQGRPVNQKTTEITKEGIPLSIFDTRGLELAEFDNTLKLLEQTVVERSRKPDPNQHIHVAWVCISEDSRRVEDGHERLVKMLTANNIPTIAVITKSRSDNGFRAVVRELLPEVVNVISVRSIREEIRDDDDEDDVLVLKPKNLDKLVELTMQVVPDSLRRAFVAAQKVDIELKKTKSHMIVLSSAATAGGIGAAPVPFADAVAIIPIQVGMLAGISATFGMSVDKAFLNTVLSSIIGGAGGTIAGRTIVSNLLKMFPGVGSAVGGAIAGTTAAALTTAIGETYIAVLANLFVKNEGKPPTNEDLSDALKGKF
jgi:uncharacterized protein (DUF697 family)/predicted GTPase